jgi:acetyl-CoA synthetase
VDRHSAICPERPAIIYEADEPGQGRHITYGELLKDVCQVACLLKKIGVNKGDRVAVYMPMIPEAFIAVLAISRIGAIHSLVFEGFSASALADRIVDAGAKVVITVNYGRRMNKDIHFKSVVDEALKTCAQVHKVLVYRRMDGVTPWTSGRDIWWHEEVYELPQFIDPEFVGSEDPLFILYTSGSTGKPKGLVHSTAGFLVGAAATGKFVFDIHGDDVFFCAGDIDWITGLTYGLYAPLLLGCATVVFEGSPLHPNAFRFWDICSKNNVSHFYVAPTALRLLKKLTVSTIPYELKSLRVLASVGEPIAPEVWKWYHSVVGKENAHVLDTYFQTETGSLVLAPLAGVTSTKPGSCSVPFFGADPVILNPVSGVEQVSNPAEGILVFRQPWPSMARTAWGDHGRYMDAYFRPYEGYYVSLIHRCGT